MVEVDAVTYPEEGARVASSDANVLVIGCGVIGLSTAVLLQESGLRVHIIAAALPHETTSSVAAAIWYPYRAYPEGRVLAWGKEAFRVFEGLADEPDTGVIMREGLELHREPASDPWWMDAVPDVRRCRNDELPPGYRDGHAFTVPIIEMPVYLDYLLKRFATCGTVEERAVSSLHEIPAGYRAVINCTGLGAREIAGDEAITPVRGQIVRVRNPGLDRFLLDDDDPETITYVVPRSRDCILGGTAEEGEWSTEPKLDVAEAILRRCSELEPRLTGVEVLEHRAGLRPGRPEVRLEAETLVDGTPCIHNYGHGGSGVTLSWGCAEEAATLVRRALEP